MYTMLPESGWGQIILRSRNSVFRIFSFLFRPILYKCFYLDVFCVKLLYYSLNLSERQNVLILVCELEKLQYRAESAESGPAPQRVALSNSRKVGKVNNCPIS